MLLFQTAKWPELDDDDDADDADDADDGDDDLPACRSRLRCFRLAMMNARPGPPGSARAKLSRSHSASAARVQRANEIGKYALATRKENMSSRTDGEMKNSQAEAEARTI